MPPVAAPAGRFDLDCDVRDPKTIRCTLIDAREKVGDVIGISRHDMDAERVDA